MIDPIGHSFAVQLDDLRSYVANRWTWPSPEAAFARYAFGVAGETDVLPTLPTDPWPHLDHAPGLATAGYLLALSATDPPLDETEWSEALTRLTSRDPFPADRQSFAYRPIELLGISLGAKHCSNTTAQARSWLSDVLRRLDERESPQEAWPCLLPALAAWALGARWTHTCRLPFLQWDPGDLSLARWLLDYHGAASGPLAGQQDELDVALLRSAAVTVYRPQDIARAAISNLVLRRTVLRRIESDLNSTSQLTRDSREAVKLVSHLCRRFHLFAKQLLVRREKRRSLEMTDEYDVQDALHALLLLHFEDVRPEEWTPSYAGNSSRMDFLLKRERIVVEAKMTRNTLRQKDVVNQLAIDKERYRAHGDCQTLVCLVYDPAGHCHNPTALEDDTRDSSATGLRTVVIVCPTGI